MSVNQTDVLRVLGQIDVPGGGTLVSRDFVRALVVADGQVKFVLEAPDPDTARGLVALRALAESAVLALPGVTGANVVLTAHGPTLRAPLRPSLRLAEPQARSDQAGDGMATGQNGQAAAPQSGPDDRGPERGPERGAMPASADGDPPALRIGRHPTAQPPGQAGPQRIAGIDRIIAIGSGKGGVGKSTVSANLAVALARAGRRVGLLDADIYGPSQPRMMGVTARPASPDGKTIIPLRAHGVTMMSIGLMLRQDEAVVWRGPMLMGALQQLLGQVAWGELDVLIVDLPPGTGDIQLTLCQRTHLTGAIVVSTPQDVALIDARRALDMFGKLNTPVLGLIENMSSYICTNCGHEAHLFGHGGVAEEARRRDLPFLGELPLTLATRLAGDAGVPVAAGDGPVADAYARLAARLIDGGVA